MNHSCRISSVYHAPYLSRAASPAGPGWNISGVGLWVVRGASMRSRLSVEALMLRIATGLRSIS